MRTIHSAWTIVVCGVLLATASAQQPILHYTFSEGGSPANTENTGTLSPGLSPIAGHTLTGTSPNRTNCLTGVAGAANQVTTPYNVAFGNNSWSIGFALNSTASPAFQYIFSEDLGTGWRVFTDGAAGAGNIRMTGATLPIIDIVGGAGEAGWVHVAFVHDTAANQIRAYLNGALFSTTAAAGIVLNSGMPLIIGRNGVTSLQNGNRVEEFRLYDYALTAAQVAAWSANALNGAANFEKIMITEASWGAPDGLEITNFSPATIDLTNWRVKWRDGANSTKTSDPLNLSIAAGESIVVTELLPIEPVPAGTQLVDRFSVGIGTTGGAITVALLDDIGDDVDEVRISSTTGTHPGWSFGSAFRGLAVRGVVSGTTGQVGVERIWGLDSDGGSDWTEQPDRSFGRENRSSGPRGTDPTAVIALEINELDDSPDYIEIYNTTAAAHNISDWFLLCSANQNGAHSVLTIPAGTVIAAGGYVVLGDSAVAPTEIPGGVPYIDIGSIPWDGSELDCALYDNLGRLVDLVRAPRTTGTLVHNFPRAPSYWSDFVGAAARNLNGGDDAIGRSGTSGDANDGGDWFPIYDRTMGSVNITSSQAGPAGHDDVFDVRVNETSLGQGFQAIMNAGSATAGYTYNFLVSIGHGLGVGPFFGLGADALVNLPLFYNIPPFSGLLDAQGSARIDFDPGSLPVGLDADLVFVLQQPGGAIVALTYVLAFDT